MRNFPRATREEGRRDGHAWPRGKARRSRAAGQEAGGVRQDVRPLPGNDAAAGRSPTQTPFRQAVNFLKPGEMSPLVTGEKALYLLRLVSEKNPSAEEFEKDKAAFEMQLLMTKREAVLGDWVRQLRQTAKVTVEADNI
ncbi:MAG: hypothetical protein MZV63_33865 [Marinilabiliales bacterium]|nr:hypothetical protein [Marinilabiliales bacterium]